MSKTHQSVNTDIHETQKNINTKSHQTQKHQHQSHQI
jgi:hypothetical protein